jgi:hypothetical protein
MTTKSVSNLSMFITVLLQIGANLLPLFFVLVAMNGYSERQAAVAFGLAFLFQSGAVIMAAVVAARLARRLFEQAKWSRLAAVAVSVFAGVSAGIVLSVLGTMVALFIGESF